MICTTRPDGLGIFGDTFIPLAACLCPRHRPQALVRQKRDDPRPEQFSSCPTKQSDLQTPRSPYSSASTCAFTLKNPLVPCIELTTVLVGGVAGMELEITPNVLPIRSAV